MTSYRGWMLQWSDLNQGWIAINAIGTEGSRELAGTFNHTDAFRRAVDAYIARKKQERAQ